MARSFCEVDFALLSLVWLFSHNNRSFFSPMDLLGDLGTADQLESSEFLQLSHVIVSFLWCVIIVMLNMTCLLN